MDPFERDIHEAMIQFHLSHDGGWLLEAIRRCAQYGKLIPIFVKEPYAEALRRYRNAEVRTLDEAFGVSREGSFPAEQFRKRYGFEIFSAVEKLHSEGAPISEELFTKVATDFPCSWSTVRNIYRELKPLVERWRNA